MKTRILKLAPIAAMLLLGACAKKSSSTSTGTPTETPSGSDQSNQVAAVINGCDTAGNPFGAGSGTVADPFLICTIAQINMLATPTYATNNFKLVIDIDATGKTIYQAAPFSGVFDGNAHAIKNWTGYGPLFQENSGTIKNLSVLNANLLGSFRLAVVATNDVSGVINNVVVQGRFRAPYMSGGVAGLNKGQITNSSANLVLTGNDHLGGLVGDNLGTITNCTAQGSIGTDTLNTPTDVTKYGRYFGGLVGSNDGGSINHSSSATVVNAIGTAGGLVGALNAGSIVQSSSTGNVFGTSDTLGGLVGISSSGTGISNSYAQGNVQGTSILGGLVGNDAASITTSYSTGAVSGSSSSIGGLVGQNNGGSATNSYWNTQTSGQPASALGTGASTAAMQTQAQFAGFDFSNVWAAPSGGYPTLK